MYWPFITTTPSQSEIFSVIVAWSYVLAFQDQTPSQSKIFFVIVAWLCVLAFHDQTPSKSEIFSELAPARSNSLISRCPLGNIFAQHLPKWNIFCYCSFIVCIGFSEPNTLPKWNIFCYCSFIVCIGFSGPNTLPKWNIFCYSSFIVCIGFSGPNTLPKWNIFCYCSLIVCIGLSGPQHPPKVCFPVRSSSLLRCPIAPYTPQVMGTPTHTWPLGARWIKLGVSWEMEVSWSELGDGSELEQAGRWERAGASWEMGASWSEGSELGVRGTSVSISEVVSALKFPLTCSGHTKI